MTQLDTILQYQTIDIQRRRKINEIENSDFAKNVYKSKDEFSKAKTVLLEAETEATPIVRYFDDIRDYCEDAIKKFDDLQKSLANVEDLQELEDGMEKLNTFRNKIIEADRQLEVRTSNGKKVIEKYKVAQDSGKKAKDKHSDNLKNLDKMRETNKIVLENFDKQLKDLRQKGNKSFFSMYDELSKEKKIPAFVPLVNADICGGCGMQMSQKTVSNLKDSESTCRCDTCSRVVYKQLADKI